MYVIHHVTCVYALFNGGFLFICEYDYAIKSYPCYKISEEASESFIWSSRVFMHKHSAYSLIASVVKCKCVPVSLNSENNLEVN